MFLVAVDFTQIERRSDEGTEQMNWGWWYGEQTG
jgi:hypothetical protein